MKNRLAFIAGALLFILAIGFTGIDNAQAYFFPPNNIPPGPPPNYNQVDTSYFRGEPILPLPPPDSGGFYVWVDGAGAWNIANHLYVKGTNIEHFHGSVLATMSTQPTPNINVFATNFELSDSGLPSDCYRQNDRWGWYQWDENLYEIWWDVSTREYRDEGDINDFMKISILGCAIDFNVWASGHSEPFGPTDIFLGSSMTKLSDVPGYLDTYPAVYDPYQEQIDFGGRNITIFNRVSGNGASYNIDGLITPGQTYYCDPVQDELYGDRFSGPFVYEGDGVQFSSSCVFDPCQSNLAPILSGPFSYEISQCVPSEYCFDVDYSDVDGNFHHFEMLSGSGVINSLTGQICFTPGPVSNTYYFEVAALDSCGLADTASYSVAVHINQRPYVSCSSDTSLGTCDINLFVCDLSPICLPGFHYGDPDANLASVSITGGTLSGDTVCFTPVVGLNIIKLVATDSCGAADTCYSRVTVTVNQAPIAASPADQNLFVCDLSQTFLTGFNATDPDGNLSGLILEGGTLHGDTAFFTPVVGANTLRLVATDGCGAVDTAITVVTVSLNVPPIAASPSDQNLFVCDLSQVCLPGFSASDPDGNLVSVVLEGGTLNGSEACFAPVVGPNTLRLIATDACGVADTSVTVVTVGLNQAPVAAAPADQNMFVCDLSQICLTGFTATDPDNNITSRVLLGGTLNGEEGCFTPEVGTNTLAFIVTDACGSADTAFTVINVALNNPPVAASPADQNLFACDLSQICLPGFSASDPDGNLASVVLEGGTLNGDEACFTPAVGINTLRLIATDACGEADTSITVVTINLNQAPIAVAPTNQNMFVCYLSQICLPGFGASDLDGNLASVVLEGGTLNGDEACFTPSIGNNILRLIATDACGAVDTALTVVNVTLNAVPIAISPNDTSLIRPDLSPVCLPGFFGSDPDGNLVTTIVLGGTLSGDTVCFTPIEGVNTLTLICTDACGAVDTSITDVTLNTRVSLSIIGGTPPEFTEEVADSILIAVTGGDPGSLTFATDFMAHPGNPARFSTSFVSPIFKTNLTFDYLGEFSSAQSPFAYRIIASDNYSADTLDLSLIVQDNNRAPFIIAPNDTTIVFGIPLALSMSGNDADLDNTLTLAKTSGPGIFNSTPGSPPVNGILNWTPSESDIGAHQAIFSLVDGRGGSDADTVTINVIPAGIVLTVIGGTPPVFTEEIADSFFVSLGGYDPASLSFSTAFSGHAGTPSRYQAALNGSAIKIQSTFDYLGEFSSIGSPFSLRIIASDDFSADTLDVSLVVNDNNRSPEIIAGSSYTVIVNQPLTFAVSGTDLDSDNTLTLNKVSGPGTFAGASGPSPVSANFNWTPNDADLPGSPYTVVFALNDGFGGHDTANVTITVQDEAAPSLQILYMPMAFQEGRIDSFVIAAHNPNGGPIGGIAYSFLPPAPDWTFPGASLRVDNDTAYLRLTFDYIGPWSSSGAPFPLRFMAYTTLILSDTAYVDVQVQVSNTNRKPDLQVSGPHLITAGNSLTLSLMATDLDFGDILTLSGANLPVGSNLTDNGNGTGSFNWSTAEDDTGTYVFSFIVDDNLGQPNSRDTALWSLEVAAPDTGGPGEIALDMGCPTTFPGTDVLVPVYLHTPDVYTGGIEILIGWDPTVLTLLGAIPTARLNDGEEYFNANPGAGGPGTVRIVWIANLNDGMYTPPMPPGHDAIIMLNFHVASGEFLFGMNIPIDFIVHHYSDNTISDSTGYQLIWPLLSSGCVQIEDPDAFRGDPNMNGQFYEIADAVLVARRIIEGYSVWTINPPVQEASADLNENSYVDVADLVWFINIINDYIDPPKLDSELGFGIISMPEELSPQAEIKISSNADIGGAMVRIEHGGLEIGQPIPYPGMEILSHDESGVLTVLVFSMSSNRIPAGERTLFTLPINGSGTMKFAEVQISDAYGRLLETVSRTDSQLPIETSLSPNYPNPFNPSTTMLLSLANGGPIALSVYDIAGRQVRSLVTDNLAAGYYEIVWDGRNDEGDPVSSGIYFARLKNGEINKTVKMSLLK